MIDEHIADGELVINKRQEQACDGQIVAVGEDDGEATLKKICHDRNRIRLEPANRTMKPIYRHRVNVLGVLVGIRENTGFGRLTFWGIEDTPRSKHAVAWPSRLKSCSSKTSDRHDGSLQFGVHCAD